MAKMILCPPVAIRADDLANLICRLQALWADCNLAAIVKVAEPRLAGHQLRIRTQAASQPDGGMRRTFGKGGRNNRRWLASRLDNLHGPVGGRHLSEAQLADQEHNKRNED